MPVRGYLRLPLKTQVVTIEIDIAIEKLGLQLLFDLSSICLVSALPGGIPDQSSVLTHESGEFGHPALQIKVYLVAFIDDVTAGVII